ncbi:hypothetical protein CLOM_g18850 [Closterium sp. NIES-68]|nr:hypothetical protein CLOM_g18850 [Closterium sp. NIES-68]
MEPQSAQIPSWARQGARNPRSPTHAQGRGRFGGSPRHPPRWRGGSAATPRFLNSPRSAANGGNPRSQDGSGSSSTTSSSSSGNAAANHGPLAQRDHQQPRQQPEPPRQRHLRHHYVPPVETPSHRAARAAAWAARERSRARPRQQGERRLPAERGDGGRGNSGQRTQQGGGNSAGVSAGRSASAAPSKGADISGARSIARLDVQGQARVDAEVRQIVHHAEAKARQQQQQQQQKQQQSLPRQQLPPRPRGWIGQGGQRDATWTFPGHATAPPAISRQNAVARSRGLQSGLHQRFRQLSPFPVVTRFRAPLEALKRTVLQGPLEAQKAVRAAVKRGEERVNSARLGAVMVVLGLWEVARNKLVQARQRHQVRSQVRVWGQRLGREAPVAARWAMTSGWGETGGGRGEGEGEAGEVLGGVGAARGDGGKDEVLWRGDGWLLGIPAPDVPPPDAPGIGVMGGILKGLGSGVLGWANQQDGEAYREEAYNEDSALPPRESRLLSQPQALWRQVASLLNPPGSVAETPERLDSRQTQSPGRPPLISAGGPPPQAQHSPHQSPALPPSSPHPPLPLLDPWAALQIAEEQFGAQVGSRAASGALNRGSGSNNSTGSRSRNGSSSKNNSNGKGSSSSSSRKNRSGGGGGGVVTVTPEEAQEEGNEEASGLVSALLTQAVHTFLRSQLDSCGDLRIKVAATGQDLLSGRLSGVSVSARAAQYKGLAVSDVDLAASSVRFGKGWGVTPSFSDTHFPVRAFLSMSASDFNRSLRSPLLFPLLRSVCSLADSQPIPALQVSLGDGFLEFAVTNQDPGFSHNQNQNQNQNQNPNQDMISSLPPNIRTGSPTLPPFPPSPSFNHSSPSHASPFPSYARTYSRSPRFTPLPDSPPPPGSASAPPNTHLTTPPILLPPPLRPLLLPFLLLPHFLLPTLPGLPSPHSLAAARPAAQPAVSVEILCRPVQVPSASAGFCWAAAPPEAPHSVSFSLPLTHEHRTHSSFPLTTLPITTLYPPVILPHSLLLLPPPPPAPPAFPTLSPAVSAPCASPTPLSNLQTSPHKILPTKALLPIPLHRQPRLCPHTAGDGPAHLSLPALCSSPLRPVWAWEEGKDSSRRSSSSSRRTSSSKVRSRYFKSLKLPPPPQRLPSPCSLRAASGQWRPIGFGPRGKQRSSSSTSSSSSSRSSSSWTKRGWLLLGLVGCPSPSVCLELRVGKPWELLLLVERWRLNL